jgi:prolyl-tRNA editing enzyme YbaK/EbsC (Cys-tRNA(Pro) deacylase)
MILMKAAKIKVTTFYMYYAHTPIKTKKEMRCLFNRAAFDGVRIIMIAGRQYLELSQLRILCSWIRKDYENYFCNCMI